MPAIISKCFFTVCLGVTLPSHCLARLFPSSTWAKILYAIGYGLLCPFMTYFVGMLQRDLSVRILQQPYPWYMIGSTLLLVCATAQRDFENQNMLHFGLNIPNYVSTVGLSVLLSFADAQLPVVRRRFLRYGCSGAVVIMGIIAVTLRLPNAATEGYQTWFEVGAELVSNFDVMAKFSVVLFLILIKGSIKGWTRPSQCAYLRSSTVICSPCQEES